MANEPGGFSDWLYSPTEYPPGFGATHPETIKSLGEATIKGLIRMPEFLQPIVEAQMKGPLATVEATGETAYGLARYPFDAARRLINAFGAGIEEPPQIGQKRQPASTSKEILDMYAQNPVLLAFDLASVFGSGTATMKAGVKPRTTMPESQYRANLPQFEKAVAEIREGVDSPSLQQPAKPKEARVEIPATEDINIRQIKEAPTTALMDELLEMQKSSKTPLSAEKIAGMTRPELEFRVSGGRIKPEKPVKPEVVEVPRSAGQEPSSTMPKEIQIGGSMPGLKEAVARARAVKEMPPIRNVREELSSSSTGPDITAFREKPKELRIEGTGKINRVEKYVKEKLGDPPLEPKPPLRPQYSEGYETLLQEGKIVGKTHGKKSILERRQKAESLYPDDLQKNEQYKRDYKAWANSPEYLDYKSRLERYESQREDVLEQRYRSAGSTLSQARYFENAIKKAGLKKYEPLGLSGENPPLGVYSYRRHGRAGRLRTSKGESEYYDIYSKDGELIASVRFSDHAQPVGGGFNIEKQNRSFGEADFSVDPGSGTTWRDALDYVQKLQKADMKPVSKGEGLEAFKGPAQIAKETMPKEGEPVGVQHIREFFSRSLRVPIFTGFKGKGERVLKSTGVYNKKAETIAMKDWGDVAALTHEVAHHIDKGYKFSDLPGYKEELGKLDYEPTKSRPNEGFAEYVRHYLTESAKPEIMAPKFTESFTQFLAQHPELKETLETGKDIISHWRNEGSEARVTAHIDWKGRGIAQTEKEKVQSGIARVRTLFEDDWRSVETLEKKATGEADITAAAKEGRIIPSESPTLQYRANKMAADRKAMEMVLEGTFDVAGNKTGPSLREALAPISNQKKQFALYGTARRALELHKRGINPGIDLADATFIRDKYDSPIFRKAFEDYHSFNDRVWDYVVESGAIDRQAVDAMKALNNEYFPFYRVMDSKADLASLSTSSRWANLPSPIKKIRGSGRRIINPYHSMVKNVSFLIGLADKARVGRALAKMTETEGMGALIREVELPKATTKFNLEQLETQLKQAGLDVSQASLDQIVTVYTNAATRAINRDNIITLVVDGKKKAYQVHADVYKTLMSMDRMQQPFFVKYFFAPVARAVRLGATGLRPGFSLITNPIRDVQGAWLQSEFIDATQFPASLAKATIDRFNPSSEMKQLYARSGVDMAHFIGADRKSLEKAARQVLASDAKKKALNVVSHPIEALKEVLSVTESIPRLAEFEAAYKKGEKLYGEKSESAQILASAAARDVTVNFTRMGAYGSVINQIIPFWNANVQGLAKFARFARDHPVKASVKAVSSLTIPTAILWNIHKDEQWYKELPAWEKYSFWHFNMGKNPDGSDKIMRLPKPFEWTSPFAGGPELALNYYYTKDPEGLKEGLRAIVDQLNPGTTVEVNGVPLPIPADLPPSIKVPIELWANYDFFRDRSIDPYWEARSKDPEDRFSPYTTETAKFIGKTFGLSPRKIDHLTQGLTGGLASGLIRTGEGIGKIAATGELPAVTHPANIPVAGRLFTRTETPEARAKRIQFEKKELSARLGRLRDKGRNSEADKLIQEWNNRYPDFRF